MVEMQLRAEIMTLRRSNATLTRRASQLQGLLGELQPLWLEAPCDVQDQVRLALEAHTPRAGICATALASLPEELELEAPAASQPPPSSGRLTSTAVGYEPSHRSVCRDPHLQMLEKMAGKRFSLEAIAAKANGSTSSLTVPQLKLPGNADVNEELADKYQHLVANRKIFPSHVTVPQLSLSAISRCSQPPCMPQNAACSLEAGDSSENSVSDSDSDSVSAAGGLTPPDTARHRLDDSEDESDGSFGIDEAKIGEVMVSADTYNDVLKALNEEIVARKRLERQLASLRGGVDVAGRQTFHGTVRLDCSEAHLASDEVSFCAAPICKPGTPMTNDTMTPSMDSPRSGRSVESYEADSPAPLLFPEDDEVRTSRRHTSPMRSAEFAMTRDRNGLTYKAREWSAESWVGWHAPNDGLFDFDPCDEVIPSARGPRKD